MFLPIPSDPVRRVGWGILAACLLGAGLWVVGLERVLPSTMGSLRSLPVLPGTLSIWGWILAGVLGIHAFLRHRSAPAGASSRGAPQLWGDQGEGSGVPGEPEDGGGAPVPEAVLEVSMELVSDAVYITDAEGRIRYANPAFERLTGYTLDEVRGSTPRVLNGGQHPPAFYERLWTRLDSGRSFYGDFVNRRKDGTLYEQEAIIRPVLDGSGSPTHHIAVARDATARRWSERRSGGQERADTAAFVAAEVAHDCRNVLSVIQGHTELALLAAARGDDPQVELAEVLEAVERGTRLLHALLNLEWRTEIEPVRTPLSEVLEGILPTLRSLFSESVDIEVDVDPGLMVRVDPTCLDRILLNLAANARDAMPEGGRFTLRGSRTAGDGTPWEGEPGWVQIEVRDNGMGMDEGTLHRIFEPLFTTKSGGVARGLGMTMVARLVEANRGLVTVRSAPGEGTAVRVGFPADPEEPGGVAERSDSRAPESAAPRRPPVERVLVVDDEVGARGAMVRSLEKLGYRVLVAEDGREALDVLATSRVDLVVTDLVMPRMGGQQLYEEVRARGRSGLPFLFVSGYRTEVVAPGWAPLREANFLEKPWTLPALAGKVREALDLRSQLPA